MYFTKDKQLYRLLLSIGLPIAAQNLLTFSISMMDTLMVGGLGEVQLSAAALGNKFFFIMMILIFGIAGGSNVLIAQYWGKKDVESIHKVLAIMYRVIIAVTVFFFILTQLIPEQIIAFYAPDDPEVIAEGARYLRIVSFGNFLYTLTNATVLILRSVRTVKISNLVYGTSLVVNTFFNWLLIYGNLGAPALGIAGAAIATVMSRIAEFIIMIVFLWKFEDKLHIRPSKLAHIDSGMVRSFISNCLPVIANEGLWVAGSTVVNVIVGRLGTTVIAASSIEGQVWQLVTVVLFGLQNATAVIVGNTIGEGDIERLHDYTRTMLSMTVIVGPAAGILMFLLRPVALLFFPNFEPQTLEIAMQLMAVGSVLLFFQSINFIGMMGILRGGGDLRFVLVADVIFLWTVSVPLGLAAAFLWHWPIPLVFICLRSDEILKSGLCVWRILSRRWVKDLTIASA